MGELEDRSAEPKRTEPSRFKKTLRREDLCQRCHLLSGIELELEQYELQRDEYASMLDDKELSYESRQEISELFAATEHGNKPNRDGLRYQKRWKTRSCSALPL